jgi:hypothetical protein
MAKKLYPVTVRRPNYDLGFSKNGMAAYEAGECPLVMWPDDERESLEETVPHHVEVTSRGQTRRILMKFYRKPSDEPFGLDPRKKFFYKKRQKKLRQRMQQRA